MKYHYVCKCCGRRMAYHPPGDVLSRQDLPKVYKDFGNEVTPDCVFAERGESSIIAWFMLCTLFGGLILSAIGLSLPVAIGTGAGLGLGLGILTDHIEKRRADRFNKSTFGGLTDE
jgi:hypothetical protein